MALACCVGAHGNGADGKQPPLSITAPIPPHRDRSCPCTAAPQPGNAICGGVRGAECWEPPGWDPAGQFAVTVTLGRTSTTIRFALSECNVSRAVARRGEGGLRLLEEGNGTTANNHSPSAFPCSSQVVFLQINCLGWGF